MIKVALTKQVDLNAHLVVNGVAGNADAGLTYHVAPGFEGVVTVDPATGLVQGTALGSAVVQVKNAGGIVVRNITIKVVTLEDLAVAGDEATTDVVSLDFDRLP